MPCRLIERRINASLPPTKPAVNSARLTWTPTLVTVSKTTPAGVLLRLSKNATNPPKMNNEPKRKLPGKAVQVAVGVRSLFNWWMGGERPVSYNVASRRSHVCLICPLNRPETDFEIVTGTVASLTKEVMAFRHRQKMTLPDEHLLGVCDACGCDLKLKLHVPMNHILETMKEEQLQALDPKCWIREENRI